MVNHAGSIWVILDQLCSTNGSHQIIVAQLKPSLGSLGVSWLPSGVHMGILGPSCASLGSILGSPCASLGPTWTILDLPGHPEAPLSSSWCVLGVDGESRSSILIPKTNSKTKLMSFWNNAWINLGNVEHETLTATQPTQNSNLTPHPKLPLSSWFFEEHMLQVCACIYDKQN